MSDADYSTTLIQRIKDRDESALAEFLSRRRVQLLAFIERRLGAALRRKVEPEDIFQEVSAEAVRSLPTIDLGDRDPFSWLCQVAERRIIDSHRRFIGSQKRAAGREVAIDAPGAGGMGTSRPGLINLLVASMTSVSQAFSRDQKQMQLLSVLEELPPDQQQILKLRYVEGLPSKSIAEQLGKSDGAVRIMLSRALNHLRQRLGVQDNSSNG